MSNLRIYSSLNFPADMKRDKFNLVLLLLCFCTGSLSNPVPEKVNGVEIFKYEGHIDTTTSASDENLARWTISANLHQMYQHSNPNYTILKLENVKTSIFNGNKSDLHNAHEKDIPEEAKIIEQAFVLKWDPSKDGLKKFSLLFKPNEPLWSVNLKRGVANLIEFEYEKPEETSDGEIAPVQIPVFITQENLIYGDECEVEYTRKSASVEDGIVYEKKMDSLKCVQQAMKHSTNVAKAPGIKNFFDILDYKQNKLLTLKKRDKQYYVHKMESKSSMSYKTSPSATYSQQVDQVHSLVFQDLHEYEKLIGVSEFSEKKEYTYEFGDEATAGRHVYEKDSAKLTKQFFKIYDEFNELFKFSPLDMDAQSPRDLVYDMYVILSNMDLEGFKRMQPKLNEDNDFDYGFLYYLSMLSYVGTDASVKYLTEFYKDVWVQKNVEFSARMLLTFPQSLEKPSDEKLAEMEGLMDNPHNQKKISKHAAVFGFASAVANACRKDAISKKYRQKYIDMFHKKYLDGENQEEKMVCILGLVNMAECLDFDFMNSITTNSSEIGDLRTFALNGFKKYLVNYYETADKVYEIYWPLVQKKSEPLEVRVAALELLLSSHLSVEQFNRIVQNYVGDLNDPEDRQLANYILTSLHSIQNTTGYYEPLGALASEAIKNANIRRFPKTYATGKYRLSYTDSAPNVGSAYEARIVTDTKTNLFNTFEISVNNFGNSFDFGTYTLYLKLTGFVEDDVYDSNYLWRYKDTPVPELLKLLKDYNFKVKDLTGKGPIDLVLYKNNVALYARHWDSMTNFKDLDIFYELGKFIVSMKYFTLPVNDYVHIPSDIGTPIIISNYMVDISKFNTSSWNDGSFSYRSLWYYDTWIQAYNPLADAHIESYKYYLDEKNLKSNATVHRLFPPYLTWTNEEDTFTQVWDNNMGVTVDEEDRLKEYCELCPEDHEIKRDYLNSYSHDWEPIGTIFDEWIYRNEENYQSTNVLQKFWSEKLHRQNVDALPYAGPIFFLADILNYKFWLKSDLSKGSMRSRSFENDEITKTILHINHGGSSSNDFGAQSVTDIKTDITFTSLEDEVLSYIKMNVVYDWNPNFVYENTTKQTGNRLTSFYFLYKPFHTNESYKICGDGDTDFPGIRDDRLSLKPYEDTVTEIVFKVGRDMDKDSECSTSPEFSYIFKEIYSTNDKKDNLSDKMSKDYEKCIADSKDLKYTAPTKECTRVSNRFTEYDNYQLYWSAVEHFEDRNETVKEESKLFEYSRVSDDKVRVAISGLSLLKVGIPDTYSVEFYHPEMTVNPLWMSYSTDEATNLKTARSTCTITPSAIEKFNGKHITNDRKEWFAFGVCTNTSSFGLNGHTVDDKHVGFTFYVDQAVLVATVKNGHLDVTVNGNKITEGYQDGDTFLLVNFFSENVIYIQSFQMEIYYNTEYVFIRGGPMIPKQVCGLCN